MTFPAYCRHCNLDEVTAPGRLCEECQEQADRNYAHYLREQAESEKVERPQGDSTSTSL